MNIRPSRYNLSRHHRTSIRLQGYDYRQPGAYFVTLCTHQRKCLFGDIGNDQVLLNELGMVVEQEWLKAQTIRKEIALDEFIVMPNHLHGIIVIRDTSTIEDNSVGARGNDVGTDGRLSLRKQSKFLGSLIAGFKSAATTRINKIRKLSGMPVWQNRFYDHIIRDDEDFNRIREYIQNNPLNWNQDQENPTYRKQP